MQISRNKLGAQQQTLFGQMGRPNWRVGHPGTPSPEEIPKTVHRQYTDSTQLHGFEKLCATPSPLLSPRYFINPKLWGSVQPTPNPKPQNLCQPISCGDGAPQPLLRVGVSESSILSRARHLFPVPKHRTMSTSGWRPGLHPPIWPPCCLPLWHPPVWPPQKFCPDFRTKVVPGASGENISRRFFGMKRSSKKVCCLGGQVSPSCPRSWPLGPHLQIYL